MKYIGGALAVGALVFGLMAAYYAWTSFIDTSNLETVWQQVAGGTAATTFALFSVAFLLCMLIGLLWDVKRSLDALRYEIQERQF